MKYNLLIFFFLLSFSSTVSDYSSTKYKIYYISNLKAGYTSFTKFMGYLTTGQLNVTWKSLYIDKIDQDKIIPNIEIERRAFISEPNEWCRIFVLREPLERLFSGWNQWCRLNDPTTFDHQANCVGFLRKTPTFSQFVEYLTTQNLSKINPHFKKQTTTPVFSKYGIESSNGVLLMSKNINFNNQLWNLFQKNKMIESYPFISQALKIVFPLSNNLPQNTQTENLEVLFEQECTEEIRNKVSQLYEEDYKLFNEKKESQNIRKPKEFFKRNKHIKKKKRKNN